jgi:RHS repeat-associated protein
VRFATTHTTNSLTAYLAYRFHFNGKETDNEVYGEGNALDFGARIYDSRLGRWHAVDPLLMKQPDQSTYKSFNNNPIIFIDPDGKTEYEAITIVDSRTGKSTTIIVPISDKYVEKKVFESSSCGHDEVYHYEYYHIIHQTTVMIDKNGNTHVIKKETVLSKEPAYSRHPLFRGVPENHLMDGDFAGSGDYQEGGIRLTSGLTGGADPTKYKALNDVESADIETFLMVTGAALKGMKRTSIKDELGTAEFINTIKELTETINDARKEVLKEVTENKDYSFKCSTCFSTTKDSTGGKSNGHDYKLENND